MSNVRSRSPLLLFSVLLGLGPLSPRGVDAAHEMGVIEITGDPIHGAERQSETGFSPSPGATPDTAGLLKRLPGAAVNRNGALTGIAQYRGLFGDRVNVMVDGMHINSGGPNAMDPPLSYIPHTQLDRITLIRGIASVSSGAQTLGGTILVESEGSEFGFNDAFETRADMEVSAASINDSAGLGLGVSHANRHHRLHLRGSYEQGGDIDFPDGVIRPTEHRRANLTAGYGFRRDGQEWGLNLRRNDTGESGTPALPMDIIFIDTNIAATDYEGRLGRTRIDAGLYASTVDHRMDNHSLRPVAGNRRTADTESDGLGFRLGIARPRGRGELRLGLDGHLAGHDAVITDPTNPMFLVDNFNDIEYDTLGLYAEWIGEFNPDWELEAGVRLNHVRTDAGEVSHSMAAMNPGIATLRTNFNAADRSRSDTNVDWVLKLDRHLSRQLSLHLGLARKMRSPSYQERYLWVPLQSTGGLADGRTYIGDIGLEPETSHQIELGADWSGPRGYLSPRIFHRKIRDYIQGTPSTNMAANMVSTMMTGEAPLQFSNVEATLTGLDASWGIMVNDRWSVDGVISIVDGERDDIDDNLYRIAPPNMRVGLTHRRAQWSMTLEGVAYARQDDVSATNGETETGGYGLINLSGEYRLARDTRVLAGIDNLLDRTYRDHLDGYNRAVNPDITIGERLPGAGRNLYVSLSHSW